MPLSLYVTWYARHFLVLLIAIFVSKISCLAHFFVSTPHFYRFFLLSANLSFSTFLRSASVSEFFCLASFPVFLLSVFFVFEFSRFAYFSFFVFFCLAHFCRYAEFAVSLLTIAVSDLCFASVSSGAAGLISAQRDFPHLLIQLHSNSVKCDRISAKQNSDNEKS